MLYVNENIFLVKTFVMYLEKKFLEKNGSHHQRWHDVTHGWISRI